MFKTLILIIHHFVFAVTLYYDNILLHYCMYCFLETMVLFISMVPNAIKIFSVIHLIIIIYYFHKMRIYNHSIIIFS